jgi:hypothetical protein
MTHDELFGRLKRHAFTPEQAAEYLEITQVDLVKYWAVGQLKGTLTFASADLRAFKKELKEEDKRVETEYERVLSFL